MTRHSQKLTAGGILIALGIIYGDIGTSPLYVLKAIVGIQPISTELVLGGLSCIFWTLTLQTTLKYVALTLEADNRGEGGIFALYALVRRRSPWLIVPAIIGGSALLADGMITPPISVSSAIEGLRLIYPDIPTIPIVILILTILFAAQQFGTRIVGKSFGPVMVVWFSTLAILGANYIAKYPEVLNAINPVHAFQLLFEYPGGFWLLGAVFLCTTGAEALYSDLGHCGRRNIRVSWLFVKTSLLLNYFGQGAWLLMHNTEPLGDRNPFYSLMPEWFLVPGIVLATVAAVIASQALISGSFTLITEATRLFLFPKVRVIYPTNIMGQLYVPFVNGALLVGCIGVVLYFRESSNMEAAYGMAITITMIMTTILLASHLASLAVSRVIISLFLLIYIPIEASFLMANLIKFSHGGWVTLIIGGLTAFVMWVWYRGSQMKRRYTEFTDMKSCLSMLADLSSDNSIDKYATHLVYMTESLSPAKIEKKIAYSLFQKHPKRADVYWFIHVDVLDEPFALEYKVTELIPKVAFRIDFQIGFRVEPGINLLFRKVIEAMAEKGEVDIISRYASLQKYQIPGDFRFVVIKKILSNENMLPFWDKLIIEFYFFFKKYLSLKESDSFGLDTSFVTTESVPIFIAPRRECELKRI
jgi:KUP system potassium uptake protein